MIKRRAETKTALTRCQHILKKVKMVADRPTIHTKMAHFLPPDLNKTVDCENGTSYNRHILKTALCEHSKMTKTEYFSASLKRA